MMMHAQGSPEQLAFNNRNYYCGCAISMGYGGSGVRCLACSPAAVVTWAGASGVTRTGFSPSPCPLKSMTLGGP